MIANCRQMLLTAAAAGLAASAPALALAATGPVANPKLAALLDAFVDELLRDSPETATGLGLRHRQVRRRAQQAGRPVGRRASQDDRRQAHAIEWMVGATGRSTGAITSEVDRYCVTPGQACGYKVGHTEIVRLREKAKAALGGKFDIRDYNDAVVSTGGTPLAVLESVIDRYVAGVKRT